MCNNKMCCKQRNSFSGHSRVAFCPLEDEENSLSYELSLSKSPGRLVSKFFNIFRPSLIIKTQFFASFVCINEKRNENESKNAF